MRKLISCKYHEDSQTVELLYKDGMLIDIDCMAVEDEAARNMYERSELDFLLTLQTAFQTAHFPLQQLHLLAELLKLGGLRLEHPLHLPEKRLRRLRTWVRIAGRRSGRRSFRSISRSERGRVRISRCRRTAGFIRPAPGRHGKGSAYRVRFCRGRLTPGRGFQTLLLWIMGIL